LVTRTRLGLSISLAIAVASLICYAAFAQPWHSGTSNQNGDANTRASVAPQTPDCDPTPAPPPGNEEDPEFVKLRRQWQDQYFGLGDVSPADHAKALAWAHALPVSPLALSFIWQPLSPMWNDWGNGGCSYGCQKPFPPNSPCGSSARIEAIAVDPSNANGDIVYLGTEGGVSKSTDGGVHWSYVTNSGIPSQSIRSLAIDSVAPNIIYAGTGVTSLGNTRGVGIYRSTNSGATWTTDLGVSQFGGKSVGKIAIDPATAGSATSTTLYASVTDNGSHTIWKSINSGTTWSPLPIRGPTANAGGFYDIIVVSGPSSTIYATAPDGLFKSTNGGFSWSSSLHALPNPSAATGLAYVQSKLYLAYQVGSCSLQDPCHTSVATSTNGGSTWTESNPSNGGIYCFGVDPVHPSRIFIGAGGDLRYSTDSGTTWFSAPPGCNPPLNACVHVDVHSIAFCAGNSERSYLGTDGGIYRTDNGGTGDPIAWWSKNENFVGALMYGISISSDGHMVQGNQDNGTQLGWNGRNPPWHHIYGGDGWKPKIDQTNSGRLYYVYYDGSITRVVLTGGNYVYTNVTPSEAITNGETSWFFPAMFAALGDWNRVTVGFRNVYRSTNSGNNWTRIGGGHPGGIDPTLVINILYEAPSNTDVIYAIAAAAPINNGKKVYVTSNASQGNSASWTNRTSNLPSGDWIRAVTVHPIDQQTAYVAGTFGVYKTTNMGVSWTQRSPVGSYDVAIDPVSPEHIFVATDSGVYLSTDGGTNWESSIGIPFGMHVTSLSFNATSRKLAASTYGRGAYVADLLGSSDSSGTSTPPKSAAGVVLHAKSRASSSR
jgi:photosystem II stability/assembly factor-like uncharacterized protein